MANVGFSERGVGNRSALFICINQASKRRKTRLRWKAATEKSAEQAVRADQIIRGLRGVQRIAQPRADYLNQTLLRRLVGRRGGVEVA